MGDWTVFVSSHDIEEVERLADHIALLEAGRLQFSEPITALLGRCRRVDVTVPGARQAGPPPLPPAWLEYEAAGDLVRFVDTQYNPEATARLCRDLFPGGTVNADTLRQDGDLNQLIWNVPEIIADLSKMVELAAGDIIMTGTPAGVAACVAGDKLECAVEGVGTLSVTIGPALK